MPQLLELSDEMLLEIFKHIPVSISKSLRLVNHRFARLLLPLDANNCKVTISCDNLESFKEFMMGNPCGAEIPLISLVKRLTISSKMTKSTQSMGDVGCAPEKISVTALLPMFHATIRLQELTLLADIINEEVHNLADIDAPNLVSLRFPNEMFTLPRGFFTATTGQPLLKTLKHLWLNGDCVDIDDIDLAAVAFGELKLESLALGDQIWHISHPAMLLSHCFFLKTLIIFGQTFAELDTFDPMIGSIAKSCHRLEKLFIGGLFFTDSAIEPLCATYETAQAADRPTFRTSIKELEFSISGMLGPHFSFTPALIPHLQRLTGLQKLTIANKAQGNAKEFKAGLSCEVLIYNDRSMIKTDNYNCTSFV